MGLAPLFVLWYLPSTFLLKTKKHNPIKVMLFNLVCLINECAVERPITQ